MTASVYALLQFPSNDPVLASKVEPYSQEVQNKMNLMPKMMNEWQQNDVGNGNTGGYFKNPAAYGAQTVKNSACTFVSITSNSFMGGNNSTITTIINNTKVVAANLASNTAVNFLDHTNRLSNVSAQDERLQLPHYETATGYGKMVSYMVNKTDGIQNNSVILGSFSSVLAANNINANANVFLQLTTQFQNSIYSVETGDPESGYSTVYYSNISQTTAQTIYDTYVAMNDEMSTRRQQDINFFTNLKTIQARYSEVSKFDGIGRSESDLIMNHIGTDKIKERLSSQ